MVRQRKRKTRKGRGEIEDILRNHWWEYNVKKAKGRRKEKGKKIPWWNGLVLRRLGKYEDEDGIT